MAQRDSIKVDFVAGGGADAAAKADTLSARIAVLSGDVDRAFNAVNAQRAPIEGWSGAPTVDQQKALGFGTEDARKALMELNTLTATDIPAAYQRVAKRAWGRPVKGVTAPPPSTAALPKR